MPFRINERGASGRGVVKSFSGFLFFMRRTNRVSECLLSPSLLAHSGRHWRALLAAGFDFKDCSNASLNCSSGYTCSTAAESDPSATRSSSKSLCRLSPRRTTRSPPNCRTCWAASFRTFSVLTPASCHTCPSLFLPVVDVHDHRDKQPGHHHLPERIDAEQIGAVADGREQY